VGAARRLTKLFVPRTRAPKPALSRSQQGKPGERVAEGQPLTLALNLVTKWLP
jgi:hypothetical protein